MIKNFTSLSLYPPKTSWHSSLPDHLPQKCTCDGLLFVCRNHNAYSEKNGQPPSFLV